MSNDNNSLIEEYDFEISLSFAGDRKREKIRKIVNILKSSGEFGERAIFFDEDFQDQIPGVNANTFFQDVFHKRTRLIVTCICKRYGEKAWTLSEWRAIQAFFQRILSKTVDRLRFYPIQFDDNEIDLDGWYDNLDVPLKAMNLNAEEIADHILKRYRLFTGIATISRSQSASGEVSKQAVNALIGMLRRHSNEQTKSQRILSTARIAHALLRNSLSPDVGFSSPGQHPIAVILRSLINDPIASSGETHPAIRFCVLLSELLSVDAELQAVVRGWFDLYCVPAGYNYHAVLGQLPDIPNPQSRSFWLDVHWEDSTPGDAERTAVSYLRCGSLQYRVQDERSRRKDHEQFVNLVRSYRDDHHAACPVSHASAVIERSKMLEPWEYETTTNNLLPLPVAVREESTNGQRACPARLDTESNSDWDTRENLAIRSQDQGVFVTGRLDADSSCFPCEMFQALLNCSAIGIWTRGDCESEPDDVTLRCNTYVDSLSELPALIHRRRIGAVSSDAIWRRVVLYFNPNIPPLVRDSNELPDIQQVNAQLN
jgi:hypothetical protein